VLAGVLAATVVGAVGVTIAVADQSAPITPSGWPENRYPSPPLVGQWNNVLIGDFQPRPQDMTFQKTYFGLRHTETWFDSFLVDAATGKQYKLTSTVVQSSPDGKLSSANWLPTSLQASPAGLVPNPVPAPWTGASQPPTVTLTSNDELKYTVANTRTTEQMVLDHQSFHWTTPNGDIDLQGTLATPGTQWLLPQREPNGNTDEILYLTHDYAVEGMYYGERVKGYVLLEQEWGAQNYLQTWNVQNRIGFLSFFANKYSDGTQESGFRLCGEYGSRGAEVVNNSGKQVISTNNINITQQDNGNLLFHVAGQKWRFTEDPTASTTGIYTGALERVGEKRKLIIHHALYIAPRRELDGTLCRTEPR
jgi:hypothetical protein